MARHESLSDIRAANPELSLSGSIISVAFNIPHALTYRVGQDWVSVVLWAQCLTFGSQWLYCQRSSVWLYF